MAYAQSLKQEADFWRHLFALLLQSIALLSFTACASLESNPEPLHSSSPAETSTKNAQVAGLPEPVTPFSELSYPARMRYMRDVITPQLGQSFKDYNAKRYRRFRCSSCHGRGARQGDYSMPSPSLMRLNSNDNFELSRQHDPQMVAFMQSQVTPQMAQLLGEKPFNADTNKGYGCFECHMKK